MPLRITITPGNTTTMHRQIVEQVCAAVLAGQIGDDEPLPSVRKLAEKLVINPQTVAKAYAELTREGILEPRAGRGMFVSRRRQIYTKAERTRRIEQTVNTLVTEAFVLGFTADELVGLVEERARTLAPQLSPAKVAAKGGTTTPDRGSR